MQREPFKLTLVMDSFFPGSLRRIQGFREIPPGTPCRSRQPPGSLVSAPHLGAALQSSWLHLAALVPTRGRQWSVPSERGAARDVQRCLPDPLLSNCLFSWWVQHNSLEDTKGDRLPEAGCFFPPASSSVPFLPHPLALSPPQTPSLLT